MFFATVNLSELVSKVMQRVTDMDNRRLANHPCIALWCANNENEEAMSMFAESKVNRDRYVADYHKLYIDTIQPLIQHLDPQRPFWPRYSSHS